MVSTRTPFWYARCGVQTPAPSPTPSFPRALLFSSVGGALIVGAYGVFLMETPASGVVSTALALVGGVLVAKSRLVVPVVGFFSLLLAAAGFYIGVVEPRHGSEVLGYPLMVVGGVVSVTLVRRRLRRPPGPPRLTSLPTPAAPGGSRASRSDTPQP